MLQLKDLSDELKVEAFEDILEAFDISGDITEFERHTLEILNECVRFQEQLNNIEIKL